MDNHKMACELKEQFSEDFFSDIGRAIHEAYKGSREEVKAKHEDDEAADCVYAVRRAQIETTLLSIAKKYPQIIARRRKNTSGNTHVEIGSGNFTVTVAYCKEEEGQIPEAEFRKRMADCNQTELFAWNNGSKPKHIYVIIKHGANERLPKAPSYIRIEFPTHGESKVPFIDLAELIRLVPQDETVEEIADKSVPHLKKKQQTGTGIA